MGEDAGLRQKRGTGRATRLGQRGGGIGRSGCERKQKSLRVETGKSAGRTFTAAGCKDGLIPRVPHRSQGEALFTPSAGLKTTNFIFGRGALGISGETKQKGGLKNRFYIGIKLN
jgi:hypothetical protein